MYVRGKDIEIQELFAFLLLIELSSQDPQLLHENNQLKTVVTIYAYTDQFKWYPTI